jgi:hypothetical protein
MKTANRAIRFIRWGELYPVAGIVSSAYATNSPTHK